MLSVLAAIIRYLIIYFYALQKFWTALVSRLRHRMVYRRTLCFQSQTIGSCRNRADKAFPSPA